MIPESFIQELLSRADIVELIDSYVPLRKAGANYAACCPFHSEKTPSFTVSPTKQFYHCFGCGEHGTAIGFLMEYSGMNYVEAIRELAARLGMIVPEETSNRPFAGPKVGNLVEVMGKAAEYYYAQLKASPRAVEYLKQRGISGQIAKRFNIGYAPDGWQNLQTAFSDYAAEALQQAGLVIKNEQGRLYDRFRDRVMIPIINQKNEVIAFGGRILDSGEPKYLNSPETPIFEKGRELFGLPQARTAIREKNTAIVVEGYMDVIALAQHNVENAVATLGTATSATHIQKLMRLVDRVIFCFDGDQAGQKAAWRALENSLEILHEHKHIGFVFLPQNDDPDDFIRKNGTPAFEKLMLQATPLSDFLVQELSSRGDMNTIEGRSLLVSEAKPLLSRLQSTILRLQLVKRVAQISGFSQEEVERLCGFKPVFTAAPAHIRAQPPSLLNKLMRLLMQKPVLAGQLPLEALPEETTAATAIAQFCRIVLSYGENVPEYALLQERLRGSDAEHYFSETAAQMLNNDFDEEQIDSEFSGAIEKLVEQHQRRKFQRLQKKAQQLGVAGLSGDEKQDYLRLLGTQSGSANVD